MSSHHPDSQTVFYGAVITPDSLSHYSAYPRCLLCVGASGDIDWLAEDVHDSAVQDVLAQHGAQDAAFVELKHGEFLMPGFVDTHTHAPQVPNIGSGGQDELLDWLSNTTFPMEAKFADVDFARRAYSSVVRRFINSGTTTCCYYGTLHLEATKILADIVHSYGQRAFVGKCNMDRSSPADYVEPSATASVAATEALIAHIRALAGPPLVQPVLTPRFAISCTPPLLTALGALARADPSLLVQTHISENVAEVAFVRRLFPECASYADVYDRFGLLGARTVLAHAVHLDDEEVHLVKERDAGVSHCPTSNFNLRSGICNVGNLLDHGIKVGLGTDVSGGFSTSIITAIQHASTASKVLAFQAPAASLKLSPPALIGAPVVPTFSGRQLPLATLLHMATLGGAHVCGLQHRVGSFAQGKAFDALLVDLRDSAGNLGLWGVDGDRELGIGEGARGTLGAMLERFFFTGDDRNVRRVYVQGRWIGGAEQRR
ncbi:Metallo-dependent hydrolase [Auriscalpium vulgare]|uniref:Metallo-dependent hydrolase n=1 Tax=Auriscalpium vulgare TaxID=40419 RepID=A0ACB8SCP3_9AGAM|nr:Metallo-dependent hydrolase [Auriscalpium vulgare]